MALLYDDKESQDRRLQMLLTAATNIAQLSQQKQIANQENEYRLKSLAQDLTKNKASMQGDFAKLGYQPATPRSLNEQNMASNPNRGEPLTDAYGQSYTPNPKLLEARQRAGTPRFIQNEDGTLQPLPGILVETPQQKLDRKNAGSTADQKNALQANQSAQIVFGELQRLSKGLEDLGGYAGLVLKGGNVIARGSLSPEAQAYKDFMPAAGVSLYRGITGDSRLSDADAASRAYPLVWDIGEDGSVKGIKEKNIQNLLSARNILLSNNIYATNKKDKITSLEDVMFVSNAVNQGATEEEVISFLKSRKK